VSSRVKVCYPVCITVRAGDCQTAATQGVKLLSISEHCECSIHRECKVGAYINIQPGTNLTLYQNELVTFHIASNVRGQIFRLRNRVGPEGDLKYFCHE
jgi:hypothetical protein